MMKAVVTISSLAAVANGLRMDSPAPNIETSKCLARKAHCMVDEIRAKTVQINGHFRFLSYTNVIFPQKEIMIFIRWRTFTRATSLRAVALSILQH